MEVEYSGFDKAKRHSQAQARALSKASGIPLHPDIPEEPQRQTPSRTMGRGALEFDERRKKQQKQEAFEGSRLGTLLTLLAAAVLFSGCWIAFIFFANLLR